MRLYNIQKHNNRYTVITCTKIPIKHHYNMHKHINTNTYVIQVQWQNKSFTVNIQFFSGEIDLGIAYVKCTNVSPRT